MDKVVFVGRDFVPERMSLGAGETLEVTFVLLGGASLDLEVSLDGEGASLDAAGLYLVSGDDKANIRLNVRHNVPGCTSRQLFKGLAGGSSKASFDGLVYVAPGAFGTKASQENHSILLSSEAVAESRPQLEIYADDVECSHGATSGSLDPDSLFYMRSRGIPEQEAKRLQILSFLAPVLNRLPERQAEEAVRKIAEL